MGLTGSSQHRDRGQVRRLPSDYGDSKSRPKAGYIGDGTEIQLRLSLRSPVVHDLRRSSWGEAGGAAGIPARQAVVHRPGYQGATGGCKERDGC